jgi:hypothetical protein
VLAALGRSGGTWVPLVASLLFGRRDVQLRAPQSEIAWGIHVGRVETLGAGVELMSRGKWRTAKDDSPIATGDSLRTSDDGAAVIDVAWAVLTLGPGSSFRLLPSRILAGNVESGRVEERSSGGDIVRLQTAEASVTGRGHVVVRRDNHKTAVSAVSGTFVVHNSLGTIEISDGRGTVVEAGKAPEESPLPPAPSGIAARTDPVYVIRGTAAPLQWTSSALRHHVQVLTETDNHVVTDVEVESSSASASPPLGLYRWRVSAVDASGLESPPSAEGLICVVDHY